MEPQIYSGYRICNAKIPVIGQTSHEISKNSKCCGNGKKKELDEKPNRIMQDIPGWRANIPQPEKKVIRAVPIKQTTLPMNQMQMVEKVVVQAPTIVAPIEVSQQPKIEAPKAEAKEEKKEEEKKLEEILLKPQVPVPPKPVQQRPDILLIHDMRNASDVKNVLEELKKEESELGNISLLSREDIRKDTVPKTYFIAFHFFSNPNQIFPHELNSIQNECSRLCKNNCIMVALDRPPKKSFPNIEEIEKTGFMGQQQFEKRYVIATHCSANISPSFLTKNSFPELMRDMKEIYQEFEMSRTSIKKM